MGKKYIYLTSIHIHFYPILILWQCHHLILQNSKTHSVQMQQISRQKTLRCHLSGSTSGPSAEQRAPLLLLAVQPATKAGTLQQLCQAQRHTRESSQPWPHWQDPTRRDTLDPNRHLLQFSARKGTWEKSIKILLQISNLSFISTSDCHSEFVSLLLAILYCPVEVPVEFVKYLESNGHETITTWESWAEFSARNM